jgi:hypothetical protein
MLTSKVIPLDVLLYHHILPILLLDRHRRSLLDKEEVFSLIPLLDDILSFAKGPRLEDVGDLGAFLRLQRGENGDLGEEGLVQATLAGGVLMSAVSIMGLRRGGWCGMRPGPEPRGYTPRSK